MTRESTKTERMTIITPIWLKQALSEIAKSRGVSLSEVVKDSLKATVTKMNKVVLWTIKTKLEQLWTPAHLISSITWRLSLWKLMKMSRSVMPGTTSCQKCPALSFIKSKLNELAVLVDDVFRLMASGKHMVRRDLGHLEPIASLQYRTAVWFSTDLKWLIAAKIMNVSQISPVKLYGFLLISTRHTGRKEVAYLTFDRLLAHCRTSFCHIYCHKAARHDWPK